MASFTQTGSLASIGSNRTSLWSQLEEISSTARWLDILVFSAVLGFGMLHFFAYQRTADYYFDDVFYVDAGRSLLHHGYYGINGHVETNQPPGLPALLALLSFAGITGHAAFLRVMAVCETLGLLFAYELFRRQVPRVVAASICILLVSSQVFFSLATRTIFPSYPYFLTTMLALLVARKFESSIGRGSRIIWGTGLTLLIALSMMFASAAMAFLGAIALSVGSLFLRDRRLALARAKMYLPVFLIALVVQGIWMAQKPAPLEWPLPGYPHSYLAQLAVKSGNEPELGMATLSDIPVRILKNAADDSILLSQALLRRWVDVAWMSLLVTGPIVLIVVGWAFSVWRWRGGLQDWYFAGYALIYLLWPWKMEPRFFLPIMPLACLYIWQGGRALVLLAKERPRFLGVVWYPVAVVLAISSWFWMHGTWIGSHLTHAGLQDEWSFAVWVISAALAVRMLWAESAWQQSSARFSDWFSRPIVASSINPRRLLQFLGILTVSYLVLIGLTWQVSLARTNFDSNSPVNNSSDVTAAEWIKSNTEPGAVIMARHVPIVYHFAERKLVWFPPSANAAMLYEGIKKHNVNYIITVSRRINYYLPPEDDGMAALLSAYPEAFELVHLTPTFRVFRVIAEKSQKQETSQGLTY